MPMASFKGERHSPRSRRGAPRGRPAEDRAATKAGGHKGRPYARALVLAKSASKKQTTNAKKKSPPNKARGGGAPGGAHCTDRATATDVTTRRRFGRGARHGTIRLRGPPASGAHASRRSAAVLASAPQCQSSIQAALHAMGGAGVTRALVIALKRSTSRAGRSTGGVDARIARERLARPPAGTAPTPHLRSHPECALRRVS